MADSSGMVQHVIALGDSIASKHNAFGFRRFVSDHTQELLHILIFDGVIGQKLGEFGDVCFSLQGCWFLVAFFKRGANLARNDKLKTQHQSNREISLQSD